LSICAGAQFGGKAELGGAVWAPAKKTGIAGAATAERNATTSDTNSNRLYFFIDIDPPLRYHPFVKLNQFLQVIVHYLYSF
jgi:hypothetical protein